ncbi:MAG: hypothetical protein JST59_00555 [Actinobacteria bacterium]|nr:hypothetical protein [Actinomycetota bacterium]
MSNMPLQNHNTSIVHKPSMIGRRLRTEQSNSSWKRRSELYQGTFRNKKVSETLMGSESCLEEHRLSGAEVEKVTEQKMVSFRNVESLLSRKESRKGNAETVADPPTAPLRELNSEKIEERK